MKEYDALEAAYKNGFEAGRNSAITHAEWIIVRDLHGRPLRLKCPVCGWKTISASRYCPGCGSEMNSED